jgi:hypothetical protein
MVPQPSSLEVEVATENMNRCKSPGVHQIPAELIQAGGNSLHSEIHKVTNFAWNREQLPQQWKEYIVVSIHMKTGKTLQ